MFGLRMMPAPGGFQNIYSLAFDGGTMSLARVFAAGNRRKYAVSAWVYVPGAYGAGNAWIFGTSSAGSGTYLDGSGRLNTLLNNGTGEQWSTTTLTLNAWNHVLTHVDTDNATAGDRMRQWINGTEVASFDRDTQPAINTDDSTINVASTNSRWGLTTNNVSQMKNGYILDELAFFDGTLPAVTDLRDGATSKPKDLTGLTFGTNGHWLRFEAGTAAGAGTDYSGNANDYTPESIVDGDISTSVP